MNPLGLAPGATRFKAIGERILRERQEIALAKDRIAGIQAAIDSKQKYLARLEAQLVLESSDSQPARAIVA